MWLVWLLDSLGLAVSVFAAVMMYRYPRQVQIPLPRGDRAVTWINPPTPGSKAEAEGYACKSSIGPVALAIGFLLQLAGTIISAYLSSHALAR